MINLLELQESSTTWNTRILIEAKASGKAIEARKVYVPFKTIAKKISENIYKDCNGFFVYQYTIKQRL